VTSRFVMKRLLVGEFGATVVEADSGLAVLEAVGRGGISLLLLDLEMPLLGGFDTLEVLRASPDVAETRVAVLTANGDMQTVQRLRPLGISDFLVKPVHRDRVIERVRRLLATVEASREAARDAAGDRAFPTLGETVLVADGDPSVRGRMARILDGHCTVFMAGSGVGALRLYHEEHPHSVFVGERLGPLAGERLLRALAESQGGKQVRLFALTGDGAGSAIQRYPGVEGTVRSDAPDAELRAALAHAASILGEAA
jgi:CheY-like chemotaxis protein